jgi:hypothetical protein
VNNETGGRRIVFESGEGYLICLMPSRRRRTNLVTGTGTQGSSTGGRAGGGWSNVTERWQWRRAWTVLDAISRPGPASTDDQKRRSTEINLRLQLKLPSLLLVRPYPRLSQRTRHVTRRLPALKSYTPTPKVSRPTFPPPRPHLSLC